MNKGKPCGNSHISTRYRCKKGVSIFPALLLRSMSQEEIRGEAGFKEHQRRKRILDGLIEKLENGRFASSMKDQLSGDRGANGKAHALDALRDAKDPKVGLLGTKNQNGSPTGFLSYKTGDRSISIQHMGTDQTEKGTGVLLFSQLVLLAAKEGKGINVASEPDASPFYEKMGMKGQRGDHVMEAKDVREFAKRLLAS